MDGRIRNAECGMRKGLERGQDRGRGRMSIAEFVTRHPSSVKLEKRAAGWAARQESLQPGLLNDGAFEVGMIRDRFGELFGVRLRCVVLDDYLLLGYVCADHLFK